MRRITRYCVIVLAVLGLSTNLVGCSNNSHHSESIKTSRVDRVHSKKSVTKNQKHSVETPKTKNTNISQSASSKSQPEQGTNKVAAIATKNQLPTIRSATPVGINQTKQVTKATTQSSAATATQFRQSLVKELPNKYRLTELEKVPDDVINTAIAQAGIENLDKVGELIAKQYPKILIVYSLYSTPEEFRWAIVNEMPGVYSIAELHQVPDDIVWAAVKQAGKLGGDLGTIASIIETQYPEILVKNQSPFLAEEYRKTIFDEMPGYYSWSELEKVSDEIIISCVNSTAKLGGDPGFTWQMLAQHLPSIVLKNDNHALANHYRQIIIEVNGATNYSAAELAKVPDDAVIDASYKSMNIGSDAGYTVRLLEQRYPNIKLNQAI